MTPNKLYMTNEDGEMVEIYGDIRIESVADTTCNMINDNHLIHGFNPEQHFTVTTDATNICNAYRYNEKMDALEKRITKLENKNIDEFDMRRVL